MKRHRRVLAPGRRHARARNAVIEAASPRAREFHTDELGNVLEDLLIDAEDFDADAAALVSDVQRMHFDCEERVG